MIPLINIWVMLSVKIINILLSSLEYLAIININTLKWISNFNYILEYINEL